MYNLVVYTEENEKKENLFGSKLHLYLCELTPLMNFIIHTLKLDSTHTCQPRNYLKKILLFN